MNEHLYEVHSNIELDKSSIKPYKVTLNVVFKDDDFMKKLQSNTTDLSDEEQFVLVYWDRTEPTVISKVFQKVFGVYNMIDLTIEPAYKTVTNRSKWYTEYVVLKFDGVITIKTDHPVKAKSLKEKAEIAFEKFMYKQERAYKN